MTTQYHRLTFGMERVVGVLQILAWILEPTVTDISLWKWHPTSDRWNDFANIDGNIPITIVSGETPNERSYPRAKMEPAAG